MLDGLDHVLTAAKILATRDTTLKARLKEAAGEFFVSLMQPGEWPKDLLEKAETLRNKLQEIDSMDHAAIRQSVEELLLLAFDVYAVYREESLGN